jgi:GNAT superfamily N-acetyltransferase
MSGIEIRDVDRSNMDDMILLCIPPERRGDPPFIEGVRVKRRWIAKMLDKYGEVAKLAYIDGVLAGIIQYVPQVEERIVAISCIYVREKRYMRRGVGSLLLWSLIEDMKKPKDYFDNEKPRGLVTWTFEVPGLYPQHKFYLKRGFKQVFDDDPHLLYYPLEEGFTYKPMVKEYIPQEEDKGRVVLFYEGGCPFSIYFLEKIKELVREAVPGIPIRVINQSEEEEEVRKRGSVSFCIANAKAIQTSFFDTENFKAEVKKAFKI